MCAQPWRYYISRKEKKMSQKIITETPEKQIEYREWLMNDLKHVENLLKKYRDRITFLRCEMELRHGGDTTLMEIILFSLHHMIRDMQALNNKDKQEIKTQDKSVELSATYLVGSKITQPPLDDDLVEFNNKDTEELKVQDSVDTTNMCRGR